MQTDIKKRVKKVILEIVREWDLDGEFSDLLGKDMMRVAQYTYNLTVFHTYTPREEYKSPLKEYEALRKRQKELERQLYKKEKS